MYHTLVGKICAFSLECKCDERGSYTDVCNVGTGQCPCLPNFKGRTCNQCADGFYGYPTCRGKNVLSLTFLRDSLQLSKKNIKIRIYVWKDWSNRTDRTAVATTTPTFWDNGYFSFKLI